MLFLIDHVHTPERCPGAKGSEAGKKWLLSVSEAEAAKKGVKLIGSYIAPTEHILIFVVEAKDLMAVEGFTFNRLALVGNTQITPVVDIKTLTKQVKKIIK